MPDRLKRQRRRLVLAALGAGIAALLQFGPGPAPFPAALAALGLAAGIVLWAPRLRHALDAGAIGLPLALILPVPEASLIGVILLTSLAVRVVLHGAWSDRMPLRLALDSRTRAVIGLPPADVWSRIVPGAGHPDDFWTGRLVDFDTDPDDPLTLYLRLLRLDGLCDEATVTFLQRDPPRGCRYVIETLRDAQPAEATVTLNLAAQAPGTCRIDQHILQGDLAPRIALGLWLDDDLGDDWGDLAQLASRRRHWRLHHRSRPVAGPQSHPA